MATPRTTVMVGDSSIDVLTARNAGALAIGVLWGYDRAGVLRERPDGAVNAPSDIVHFLRAIPPYTSEAQA